MFNLPLNQSFTYNLPDGIIDDLFGKRVLVPFKNLKKTGFVVEMHDVEPSYRTKTIIEVVDDDPIFTEFTLELAYWMAEYYLCTPGEALSLMVPSVKPLKRKSKKKKQTKAPEKRTELLSLIPEQKRAVDEVSKCMNDKQFGAYLLHGITGSGKTEVYKHLVKIALKENKSVIILVPEISLTPQLINRFRNVFGNLVTVIHSKLTPRERYNNYKSISMGVTPVVLGARSAVFSPAVNLGLIIIDEEHETTYKSSDTPRYHTRQVAYQICRQNKIPLLFGSATPNIETYYHSTNSNINLLRLEERHSAFKEQDISILDMREEKSSLNFSDILIEKIKEKVERKEQVLLFLNKRGFATYCFCSSCGYTYKCKHCDITLTYHYNTDILLCHYCGYRIKMPLKCDSCEKEQIKRAGFGTEKIEETLKIMLDIPVNIGRMDADTVRQKKAHETILSRFEQQEIDILIGTQMIAKGLHYPNVTLAGVILADISLNIPDFRSYERTFSLLTQVAGRSGRGDIKGEVLIQTYQPDNYAIQTAKKQDYEGFYDIEIEQRKKYLYPPFCRMLKLLVRGKNQQYVKDKIMLLGEELFKHRTETVMILGPAPCPLPKIQDYYRWQILMKGKTIADLQKLASYGKKIFENDGKVYLEIDVDPIFIT